MKTSITQYVFDIGRSRNVCNTQNDKYNQCRHTKMMQGGKTFIAALNINPSKR